MVPVARSLSVARVLSTIPIHIRHQDPGKHHGTLGRTGHHRGGLFLSLALLLSLSFEFVNGFHDTANAVATVIYTHTLKPTYAVVWSGCWNLLGVLWCVGAVAYSIVALLPVELVLHSVRRRASR